VYRIILSIIFCSISWRGSSILALAEPFKKPMWASSGFGTILIYIYTLLILPIAAINGYYIAGYKGFIVVGIGTIFGKYIVNEISDSFSYYIREMLPAIQFILFGTLNITFTIFNCFYL